MKYILILSMVLSFTVCALAQESTEVEGFYQRYGDFNWGTGIPDIDVSAVKLNGGGFMLGHTLAPWFALWTQVTFYGRAESSVTSVRVLQELQGVRYQTKQYGPLRLYGKGGVGFANFGIDVLGSSFSSYRPCFSYGGGAQIWMGERFGLDLEASHTIMGVPNLTDAPGRENWDSGLTLKTGIAVRF